MVNRTQTLVLGFFLVVLVSVLAIRVATPRWPLPGNGSGASCARPRGP
jgi:hypothetical protein